MFPHKRIRSSVGLVARVLDEVFSRLGDNAELAIFSECLFLRNCRSVLVPAGGVDRLPVRTNRNLGSHDTAIQSHERRGLLDQYCFRPKPLRQLHLNHVLFTTRIRYRHELRGCLLRRRFRRNRIQYSSWRPARYHDGDRPTLFQQRLLRHFAGRWNSDVTGAPPTHGTFPAGRTSDCHRLRHLLGLRRPRKWLLPMRSALTFPAGTATEGPHPGDSDVLCDCERW
jgi:hypothetical protein